MPRELSGDLMAYRGFVCHDGSVIAWPMLLLDHNDAHRILGTTDEDYALRWRQWSPGAKPDFDRVTSASRWTQDGAEQIVRDWLAR